MIWDQSHCFQLLQARMTEIGGSRCEEEECNQSQSEMVHEKQL